MITFYTCTEVTPEVYDAYVEYRPGYSPYKIEHVHAVSLCSEHGNIIIYPVTITLNIRHLAEFGSTDSNSHNGDVNILVSAEEFLNQLFILKLEQ